MFGSVRFLPQNFSILPTSLPLNLPVLPQSVCQNERKHRSSEQDRSPGVACVIMFPPPKEIVPTNEEVARQTPGEKDVQQNNQTVLDEVGDEHGFVTAFILHCFYIGTPAVIRTQPFRS